MIQSLVWQIKLAAVIAIGLLIGYVYYDVIIKPQNEIAELKETIKEKINHTTTVVTNINALDANKTQEEINEKTPDKSIDIHDFGTLFF